MEDMMIDDAEMEALINIDASRWIAPDPEMTEKQEKHVAWLEQQQKEQQQLLNKQDLYAKESALLKQLYVNEKEPRLYDYTTVDIVEEATAHCDWLLEKDIHVQKMNNTNALLRRNLIFELMTQDKRSNKITALHDRFIDLELKGNISKEDLNALYAETYAIAQNPTTDQLLLKCSEQKKRGRTSDADRLKTLNVVDSLRKEFITPKKAINGEPAQPPSMENNIATALEAAATDKYQVFMEMLRFIHENAQTNENYGAYLQRTNRIIQMDPEKADWPMQSLMKSILNMEACIGIKEIESIVIEPNEDAYYCSYSGDRIKNGDNVYHIRILEYSHERHRKWRILKNRPNREFEAPEFMESVKAFFVKKHHVSLTGLWFRDFDDSYKAQHANYFDRPVKSIIKTPVKRAKLDGPKQCRVTVVKDGHVWKRMDYMRNYINQHNLEHKEVKGKTFDTEVNRIHTILNNIIDSHSLQLGLCEIISAYYKGEPDDEEEKMASLNRLMYVLLDFIDLFYRVSPCEDDTQRPLSEKDCGSLVLRLLLDVSSQRRNHPSYNIIDNEFDKINREASDVNHYSEFSENNFLFLGLFDYLFPTTQIKKENEAIEILQMFGL